MTWDQVVELHNEVADLETGERELRLSDPGLAPRIVAEVRSLLAAETGSESPIDEPLGDLAGLSGGEPREESEPALVGDPEVIGPYRVLGRIGAGGMGVILLAERADGSFEKQVAIKLVKRGMDSEALLARFQAERQILASLEHPAIARLIDGGMSEDGRPYFVLEHVEGSLPLDEYCRRQGLSLRERLGLFRRACQAVHSAHQQLVLHRDLKPSNLLVNSAGELKLVDFGIAKLITPEGSDATMTAQRMMTPAYAAPEQLAGEPAGTYSDVYSLGVVLFQLLTGSSPTSLMNLGERTTSGPLPTRPSAALATAEAAARRAWPGRDLDAIHSQLSGDLDAIVMQCLQTDTDMRYSSARALADDLGRFLEGRPVQARPPTVAYQVRKLIARNPVASGLAALAVLALTVGSAGVFWQSRVAEAERDRATAEAGKATQVTEALISLLDMSDPALAADATEVRLRDVITENKIAEGLSEQPAVHAKMLSVLGRINTEMARYDIADEQLTAAVAMLASEFPEGHPDRVEALRALSRLRGFQEVPQDALSLAGEAVSMQRSLVEAKGGAETTLADTLLRFAKINMHTGRLDEAEAALQEALELRQRVLGADHDGVGEVIGVLGFVEYYRGRYSEAVRLVTQAVAIRKKALGPVHQGVGNELENLGAFLLAAGDRERARDALTEALETRLTIFGSEHPYVAFSYVGLGRLAQAEGDLESALELQQAALAVRQATYSRSHRLVRNSAAHTASVLTEMDRAAEAMALLDPVLEASQASGVGVEDVPFAISQFVLLESYGKALLSLGRPQEAEKLLREAVAVIEHSRGPEYDRTLKGRVSHARALLAVGRVDDAEAQNEASLEGLQRLEAPPLSQVEALALRAEIHQSRGDRAAARAAREERLALLVEELGPENRRVAIAREEISR